MPWNFRKVGNKTCAYNKATGKKKGCTAGSAKAYKAALYANALEEKNTPNKITQKDVMSGVRKSMPPPSIKHKDKKTYDRKKFKTFKAFWDENAMGLDGSQKITDDTTATAESTAGTLGYGSSDTTYNTEPGQGAPNSPIKYEVKKKNAVIDSVIEYLEKFVDGEMPNEGEELEAFLSDLKHMADELQKVGVEPVDILAAIEFPNMAQQYLIRGPSAKGNAGKGALEDLKDVRTAEILEDESNPGGSNDNAMPSREMSEDDDPTEQQAGNIGENFIDGKHPGRKGLAKRSGVNTKASVSTLRNVAKHSSGEKARMAHWLANMKAGKAKHH